MLILYCYYLLLASSDSIAIVMDITTLSLLDMATANWRKFAPKKLTYNFYNYQTTTRLESSNARWKLIVPSFIVACIHRSLPYKTVAGYICRPCRTPLANGCTLSLEESAIISGASPNSTITSSIILISITMDAIVEHSMAIRNDPYGDSIRNMEYWDT